MLKNAVKGCGEEAVVNFPAALVSQGELMGVVDATVEVTGGKASFPWTDNSGIGSASAEDAAMVLAYNKDRREAVYDLQAATRADGEAELALPTTWSDDALVIYLSFQNASNRTVSRSVCLQDDEVVQQPGGGTGEESGTEASEGGSGNDGSFG